MRVFLRQSTQFNRLDALENPSKNLKILLRERFRFLRDNLESGDLVLEIGAGIGAVSRYLEEIDLLMTDIEENPWLDAVVGAEDLPFPEKSFDAVICIAALHHMDHPIRAIKEMTRVLKHGGVLLVMEVHTSWILRLVLLLTRHEYIDQSVDPFGPESCQSRTGDNWDGNNAIGDLIFSDFSRLEKAIPQLECVGHRYVECLLFLNSGGVNFKAPYIPLPELILNWIVRIDSMICRLAPRIFAIPQEFVFRKRNF